MRPVCFSVHLRSFGSNADATFGQTAHVLDASGTVELGDVHSVFGNLLSAPKCVH